MGPDLLGEFTKPKKNTWVDNAMEEGRFGDVPGAGFEAIAGGGLHSLFIDERGTVRVPRCLCQSPVFISFLIGLVMRCER